MVCFANSSDGMKLCCVERDFFHVRAVIFIESQYNDSHTSHGTSNSGMAFMAFHCSSKIVQLV